MMGPRVGRAARRRVWTVAAALLCAAGPAVAARASMTVRAAPRARWTLMVYQDADNTLETPLMANLKAMMAAGSSDEAQVVVLSDRSPKSEPKDKYTDEDIGAYKNWSGARLLHVERGRLQQIDNWGDTNMGEAATLRRFVEAAAKAFPAEHYALILSDHGSGWSSLCVDESNNDAALSLRDVRQALEPYVKQNGKLDVIGFDACLMGSFETAQAVAPIAHIMVGSEELAPACGWDYAGLLKALQERPAMTAQELGRAIVDSYTIYLRNASDAQTRFSSMGVTLSEIDLDQVGTLQEAVARLADRCADVLRGKHREGWVSLARGRAHSEEYGAEGARGEGGEEMHDLFHLAAKLEKCGDAPVAEAAKAVEDAIKQSVKYGLRGPGRPYSGGISIYFPEAGVDVKEPLGSEYLAHTFSAESRWVHFLSLYSVAVEDYRREPTLKPIKASGGVASQEAPVQLVTQAADDDIDRVYFLMAAHDGADLLMIGRLPGLLLPDGTVGQRFRGDWFMMTDKKSVLTLPITTFEPLDESQTSYIAYVPIQVKRQGSSEWTDVTLVVWIKVEAPLPHAQVLYGFARTKQGPLQLAFKKGDEVRPVYVRLSGDGEIGIWTGRGDRTLHIDEPTDFEVAWGTVSPGAYQVGFEAVNLAGERTIQTAEVILKR